MAKTHLLEEALLAPRHGPPWTMEEYEALRKAACVVARSHRRIDLAGGQIVTCVDGKALWRLLGALDRVTHERRA